MGKTSTWTPRGNREWATPLIELIEQVSQQDLVLSRQQERLAWFSSQLAAVREDNERLTHEMEAVRACLGNRGLVKAIDLRACLHSQSMRSATFAQAVQSKQVAHLLVRFLGHGQVLANFAAVSCGHAKIACTSKRSVARQGNILSTSHSSHPVKLPAGTMEDEPSSEVEKTRRMLRQLELSHPKDVWISAGCEARKLRRSPPVVRFGHVEFCEFDSDVSSEHAKEPEKDDDDNGDEAEMEVGDVDSDSELELLELEGGTVTKAAGEMLEADTIDVRRLQEEDKDDELWKTGLDIQGQKHYLKEAIASQIRGTHTETMYTVAEKLRKNFKFSCHRSHRREGRCAVEVMLQSPQIMCGCCVAETDSTAEPEPEEQESHFYEHQLAGGSICKSADFDGHSSDAAAHCDQSSWEIEVQDCAALQAEADDSGSTDAAMAKAKVMVTVVAQCHELRHRGEARALMGTGRYGGDENFTDNGNGEDEAYVDFGVHGSTHDRGRHEFCNDEETEAKEEAEHELEIDSLDQESTSAGGEGVLNDPDEETDATSSFEVYKGRWMDPVRRSAGITLLTRMRRPAAKETADPTRGTESEKGQNEASIASSRCRFFEVSPEPSDPTWLVGELHPRPRWEDSPPAMKDSRCSLRHTPAYRKEKSMPRGLPAQAATTMRVMSSSYHSGSEH